MLKKSIFAALCAAALSLPAMAQPIVAELDGQRLNFQPAPMMIGGRVFVPLRGIFESLGAQVHFTASTQSIEATRGSRNVQLTLGSRRAMVDGRTITLDTPASTVGGSTMVPLRFVSEALGNEVRWNDATRTVSLTSTDGIDASAARPVPVPAQTQMTITSVIHNARGPLRDGDQLIVSVNGEPGARASFDILGITSEVPMRETSPGSYEGELRVRPGMQADRGTLVARLRKNGQEISKEAERAVNLNGVAANRPNYPNNAPALSDMQPAQGSLVDTLRPMVNVGFESPVLPNSARMVVDGIDVTSALQINNNRLSYSPIYDMAQGTHSVTATGTDYQGRALRRDWSFQVRNVNGAYNPNPNYNPVGNALDVRFTDLVQGTSVPAVFNVQGQTTPGAIVSITTQSQRSLVPGFLNLPTQEITRTTTADMNGHFDVQVDASGIAIGQPITVQIQARDNSGRAGQPQTLNVTRR